jgi:DNA-binding transcriptional MerR regulator
VATGASMTSRNYSIGYFSRHTGLSIRALRLYDELGILKPAVVISHNKYRYYTPEQITVAEQIRTYRENELPLEEIKQILEHPPRTTETLQTHLERLKQRLTQHQTMIGQLEQMLSQTT